MTATERLFTCKYRLHFAVDTHHPQWQDALFQLWH